MAKFKKGQEKPESSGRKAGVPNKPTLLLKQAFDNLNFDVAAELVKVYGELKGADKKATYLLQLVDYLYPRRKAVEYVEPQCYIPVYDPASSDGEKEALFKIHEYFHEKDKNPDMNLAVFDWDKPPVDPYSLK